MSAVSLWSKNACTVPNKRKFNMVDMGNLFFFLIISLAEFTLFLRYFDIYENTQNQVRKRNTCAGQQSPIQPR
jgi:hypothetical protein